MEKIILNKENIGEVMIESIPKVLCKDGLPIYEGCSYIKVSNEDLADIEKLLGNIPYKHFNDPYRLFCEEEAEFRARSHFRETETDELIVEQMAMDEKENFGEFLHNAKNDILNNEYIDDLLNKYFKKEGE